MSLTEQEREKLEREFGRNKLRHIQQVHYDEMYPVSYDRVRRLAERRCINPFTAIGLLVLTACVSTAVVAYVWGETTTTKIHVDPQAEDSIIVTSSWDGNYFVWLIIPASFFYVLRKVRINVKWD